MDDADGRGFSLDEERLTRLLGAGRSLVALRDLDEVLDRLLEVARDLTGARYAAIGVLDERREQLADFIHRGIAPVERQRIGELPRGRGVLGLLITDPHPLRLDDVAAHPRSYGLPPHHPPMRTFLGVPIVIRGEAWGNLYLSEKPGGDSFDAADEETAVVLADWASIAVDTARMLHATSDRRLELERSVAALEATTEIATAVGGETRLERVLELIAKRSRALIDATGVAILLVEGEDFVVAATAGDLPRDIVGSHVKRGASVAGHVVATGQPTRVSDISSSLRFALGQLGVRARSGIFVPLKLRGLTLGVVEAFDRSDGPEFRAEDERVLRAAAASAAIAVSTAQSVERERLERAMQAAEEERRRWARELHDETLQALAGLRVLLSSASKTADTESLRGAVNQAIGQIGEEIRSLRSLITELRPAALDDLGLAPAIEALVDAMRAAHGVQVASDVSLDYENALAPQRLEAEIETAVYRVVQESLGNAARHAGAARVTVSVIEEGGAVRIVVMDDGRGFDVEEPPDGFGLSGMRERMALAGGQLLIESGAAGTTVSAELPAVHRRQAA